MVVTTLMSFRAHNSDEDVLSQLMAADDKRHKHDSHAASQENQLLLSHVLLVSEMVIMWLASSQLWWCWNVFVCLFIFLTQGCLESQSEEEPGTKGRSHLLTDRDPILGGQKCKRNLGLQFPFTVALSPTPHLNNVGLRKYTYYYC